MKVLIVDDDSEALETLEVFFNSLGFSVEKASNAASGLQAAVTKSPQVVFLDIRLPDRDGLEILREIKKLEPNLPVVMITAYRDADKVVDAFRVGALDCILKPFNFEYIRENILPRIKRL